MFFAFISYSILHVQYHNEYILDLNYFTIDTNFKVFHHTNTHKNGAHTYWLSCNLARLLKIFDNVRKLCVHIELVSLKCEIHQIYNCMHELNTVCGLFYIRVDKSVYFTSEADSMSRILMSKRVDETWTLHSSSYSVWKVTSNIPNVLLNISQIVVKLFWTQNRIQMREDNAWLHKFQKKNYNLKKEERNVSTKSYKLKSKLAMKLIHENSAQFWRFKRFKLIFSDWIIATGSTADISVIELISSRFNHFIETLRSIRIDGQFQKCSKNCTIIIINWWQYLFLVTIFITCMKKNH